MIIEFFMILTYIGLNGTLLGLAIAGILPISAELILPKLAATNLSILYLGGRSNPIIDSLGVSLQTYYMAHALIGYTAPVQATAHSLTAWLEASKSERITGAALCVLTVATLFSSLRPLRELCAKHFTKIHGLLSFLVYSAMVTHVLATSTSFTSYGWILVFASASAWLISQFTRLIRWHRRGVCRVLRATPDGEIIRIQVEASRPITAQPGQYFYIYRAGMPLRHCLESRLAPVAFWEHKSADSLKKFTFLLERKWAAGFRQGGKVMLDGPYGKRLAAGCCTTIILAANGIGISGILPFILSVVSRKQHNAGPGSKTMRRNLLFGDVRRLDLLWMLDHESQISWLYPFCSQLGKLRDTEVRLSPILRTTRAKDT